jgi:hypothetical protein
VKIQVLEIIVLHIFGNSSALGLIGVHRKCRSLIYLARSFPTLSEQRANVNIRSLEKIAADLLALSRSQIILHHTSRKRSDCKSRHRQHATLQQASRLGFPLLLQQLSRAPRQFLCSIAAPQTACTRPGCHACTCAMPRPKKPGVEPKRRSRNGCW